MEPNNENSYQVVVNCQNCGFHGDVQIPKQQMIQNYECPNCGNCTLMRYISPAITKQYHPKF